MMQIYIDTWLTSQTSRETKFYRKKNVFFLILDNTGELASRQICRTTQYFLERTLLTPQIYIYFFLRRKIEVWKQIMVIKNG